MNSRRLSKPNLPSALKPSKLLAPTRLRWTLSSLAYRIPQSPIASTKMNWSLPVRLNLINHFVGFISGQFACNSAFRNPIFRWESCKSSVWESVKKSLSVCTQIGPRGWISRLARSWQVAKLVHVWSMQGSWRVMPAVALQDKSSSLAR